MRKDEFLELIHNIDDELIEEATEPCRAEKRWKKSVIRYGSIAACGIIALMGYFSVAHMRSEQKHPHDNPTAEVSQSEEKSTFESNAYYGNGSGEFFFNNSKYHIVNNQDYLISNNMPLQVSENDLGKNLANNIFDTNHQNVGNIYQLNYSTDESMVAVQNVDGTYCIAVKEEQ
jgi:hypothetical protein